MKNSDSYPNDWGPGPELRELMESMILESYFPLFHALGVEGLSCDFCSLCGDQCPGYGLVGQDCVNCVLSENAEEGFIFSA